MPVMEIIIYAVMAAAVLLSVKDWIRLISASKDLKRAASVLGEKQVGAEWRKRLMNNEEISGLLFTNTKLDEQLMLYEAEIADEEMGGGRYTDTEIGDYFNEELLDFIGNRARCEQTGSTLTALGILGTFLGLAFGLSGFNFSDTTNIISGIENLLGGMSTAFWTSIVGIISSIIYSAFYRLVCRNAEKNLDDFVSAFRKNVLDDQTDTALRHIVESVEGLAGFDRTVAGAVSDALDQSMEVQRKKMSDAFENACRSMAEEQTKALREMVGDFTRALRESMGTHFDELGQSIDRASREYARFSGELSQVNESMGQIRRSMEDMDRMSAQNIKAMETLTSEVSKSMEALTGDFSRSVEALTGEFSKNVDALGEDMDALKKSVEGTGEAFAQQMENVKLICEKSGEAARLQEESAKNVEKSAAAVEESAQKVLEIAGQSEKQTEEMVKQMETFSEALKDTTGAFEKSLEAHNQQYMEAVSENMKKMTEMVDEEILRIRSEKRRGLFGRR